MSCVNIHSLTKDRGTTRTYRVKYTYTCPDDQLRGTEMLFFVFFHQTGSLLETCLLGLCVCVWVLEGKFGR